MYSDRTGPLQASRVDPGRQVVVKLKHTRAARGVLRAAAAEGTPRSRPGALDRWLASRKCQAMEPIFGSAPGRGVAAFRRMAIAAEDEGEAQLAGLNVLTFGSRRDAKQACADVARDGLVEMAYVPPEKHVLTARRKAGGRRRAGADPMRNRQWGLNAIDLFRAEAAASFPDARDVIVAVIDSGIDSDHPDLQGVVIDERSFVGGSRKDTSGHGTHVTGIIAAVVNNRRGIRGVCRSRKMISFKALDPYEPSGYYRAIRSAMDAGAQVMNFSLGGPHDPTEETLIRLAMRRGHVVVAAMGNEKEEGNPRSYPAAIGGVVAVGASTEADGIAHFSNTGPHIDLVAPGVNILSTVPTYPSRLASRTDYDSWPGTSMAAPHVSATAALLLAKRPNATPAQVRRALVRGADRVPGQTGFDTTFGHGRLNVRGALARI